MTRKKRLPAKARRVQLLDVARGVFARQGFDAASVEALARAAGVTKPIVYEHFGGKEGAYAAVIKREMTSLRARLSQALSEGDALSAVVRAFLTYAREEPDGFTVLARDSPSGRARRGLTRAVSDIAKEVAVLFDDVDDAEARAIEIRAFVGMLVEVALWWTTRAPKLSLARVEARVHAIARRRR